MGSAIAFHLARRGAKVLGLERHAVGHPHGSSHGHSRVIRQAYFEDPAYVPLLRRAYQLWHELELLSGTRLLHLTGGLMLGTRGSPVLEGSLASARQHQLPHELLEAPAIRKRFPALAPTEEYFGLYETVAGVVCPEAATRAHADQAERHGAHLHWHEPALDWISDGDRVRVTTRQGTYHARQLVLSPGAWAPSLFRMNLPLRITQQTLYWFEPMGGLEPFRLGHFPVYIWQHQPGEEFYGFPAMPLDGDPGGVKVAYFYRNLPIDPDSPRTPVSQAEVEQMRWVLRERIPSLPGRLIHAQRCLYTETPDHHFVIDRHPALANVCLVSPCSGHGYKFCTVVGEIVADLVMQGQTRHPISLFSVSRQQLSTAAGLPG
jgi:sarcosine oxidase